MMAPKACVPASTSAAWILAECGAGASPLLEVHHPRRGIDDVGEGGPTAPGAGLAEAGDGAIDEVGLHRRQRRPVAAQPRDHSWDEVLHRDVGAAREVLHHLARGRMAQIEGHALLAGIDAREVGALVVAALLELEMRPAHLVALAGTLDLDHARAEIGEQASAIGAGEGRG